MIDAAVLVLIYRLREFPLSAATYRFELRCQLKQLFGIVLQNLSLFVRYDTVDIHTLGTRAKNNKKKKIKKDRKKVLSSFSPFILPISFHLNFEALVPRVRHS